ncbi:hypothetical protein EJB05_21093, partial [Eragrostis curvula]
MLMMVLLLTTLAIAISMSAAIIAVVIIKKDCTFVDLMVLENIILVLFVLLSLAFTIYCVFELLWSARNTIDEKPCSQVLLEDIHELEGFASKEVVGNDVSTAFLQELTKLVCVRCNEISCDMKLRQLQAFFPEHAKFSDILDDFWGNLFDLHGNLTENGKMIRLDLLLGLHVGENAQSFPCFFDESGLCDHLKMETYCSTERMLSLFRINDSMCPQQGHSTLHAIVDLRKIIMDSFLKENPSLLRDEKSHLVMQNDQVQHEILQYENFNSATQSVGMLSNSSSYQDSCPLEELTTVAILVSKCPSEQLAQQPSQTQICFSYNELKGLLLNSFRGCIQNISNLEKADLLIERRGGYDEKLTALAAEMVIFLDVAPKGKFSPSAIVDSSGKMFNICSSVLGCGDSCMFQPCLVISFGVWCISRICELLPLVEEPMLLEKYSRVLNRLQGILESAFLNPVHPVAICPCTNSVPGFRMPDGKERISVEAALKMLMEVEAAIYGQNREKVHGTGEKNLKSVLQQYKRRLSKASSMAGYN